MLFVILYSHAIGVQQDMNVYANYFYMQSTEICGIQYNFVGKWSLRSNNLPRTDAKLYITNHINVNESVLSLLRRLST